MLFRSGAYPAIVVCPASLKLNWLRELEHWLPERSAHALTGTGAADKQAPAADVTVVNYDILAARLDELRALAPRALVLDESHYCKNSAAKRTQAVVRLAASVPRAGLVLALTGTPVMNRPLELIPQLRILGRLGDFGSGAQFSRRFRGPDAHLRLHWHLRSRCFCRASIRSPEIGLPDCVRCDPAVIVFIRRNRAGRRIAQAGARPRNVHGRILIRPRNSELLLSLEHMFGCDTHIVILLKRGANQLLQLLVLKNFPPLLVAERSCGCFGGIRIHRSTVTIGDINAGPLVIWPDGT